jgi:hypothetical protein
MEIVIIITINANKPPYIMVVIIYDMLLSANRVLIGEVDMAIVEGISYCTHSLLTEDSSSDQLVHARLGLDKTCFHKLTIR